MRMPLCLFFSFVLLLIKERQTFQAVAHLQGHFLHLFWPMGCIEGRRELEERGIRVFVFPSHVESPAGLCLFCDFCCAQDQRPPPPLPPLSAGQSCFLLCLLLVAFLYMDYFLTSSIYLNSLVHLIPFISTNLIIKAENREI